MVVARVPEWLLRYMWHWAAQVMEFGLPSRKELSAVLSAADQGEKEPSLQTTEHYNTDCPLITQPDWFNKKSDTCDWPPPPHTRQKYEQNMTQNAAKQGKIDIFAAIFCSCFCLVCGGWGFKMIQILLGPKLGDSGSMFPGINFRNITDLLWNRPCLELIVVSSSFRLCSGVPKPLVALNRGDSESRIGWFRISAIRIVRFRSRLNLAEEELGT